MTENVGSIIFLKFKKGHLFTMIWSTRNITSHLIITKVLHSFRKQLRILPLEYYNNWSFIRFTKKKNKSRLY